jgi:hypothetical protein
MGTKKDNETLPPRIVAVYEAVSETFTDSNRIFKGKLYPLRIRLRPIAVFSKPLDFRELVPKLGFIKNKRFWVGHIRGKAMREIPKGDFETVLEVAGVRGFVLLLDCFNNFPEFFFKSYHKTTIVKTCFVETCFLEYN